MRDKLKWLLPFMTGFFLVIATFSENANRLPWGQLIQASLFGLAVSTSAFIIFYAIPVTRKGSWLISSVFVAVTMLWMSFTFPVVAVALLLVAIVVFSRLKPHITERLNTFAVLSVTGACIVALGTAGINHIRPDTAVETNPEIVLRESPDIYFIVPDRFLNHVGLLELGYNNSVFMEYLEDNGFYVDRGKVSKDLLKQTDKDSETTRTCRFLASVLNLGEQVEFNTPYNVVSGMIRYHDVGRILKENGYIYHHIGGWWTETEASPIADFNYICPNTTLMPSEELSIALLDRSIYRYLTTYLWRGFDVYRTRTMFQLESFKEVVNTDNPKFIFVHAIIPHPPFVWTAGGELQTDGSLSVYDRYIEQVKFAEWYLKQFIESANEEAIIIIQSDEGLCFPEEHLNHTLTDNQWRGVLTAWRIPDKDYGGLIDVEITGILGYVVNTLERGRT